MDIIKNETSRRIICEYAYVRGKRIYWREGVRRTWTAMQKSHNTVIDELYWVLGMTYSRELIRRTALSICKSK